MNDRNLKPGLGCVIPTLSMVMGLLVSGAFILAGYPPAESFAVGFVSVLIMAIVLYHRNA